jgi:hypothetical protein
MATSNNSFRVADLDFNSIKNNLKTYLKSQDTFKDYDFEGSGMSVLLDILAYNTYYNSFYMNMIANESFLDTAQDRKNILSHAKLIGYVPDSAHGAVAQLNIKVTPGPTENQDVNYIVLDKYTRLLGADIGGVNFPFVTINANTAYKDNGSFAFANVYVKQGEVMTHQYTVDNANNASRRYQIPSANVDTDSLVVTVQESSSNTETKEYFLSTDVTDLQANSTVYFLEEDNNLNYTIYFGDDVIGKRPANGNIITVTYLDTIGSISNNVSKFTFVEPVAGLFRNNVKATAVSGSYGGTSKEAVEDIRFRAPYVYTSQNRCVTTGDYEALVTKDYSNIEAVSVWGGEDNDPPVYGKVYLSLKTRGYYVLTDLEKQRIKDTLIRDRNVVTVIPEIVDPEYVFILIRGNITYNPTLTTKSETELLNVVKDAIYEYAVTELYTFKSTFKQSKLQQYIERSDPSITASDLTLYLQSRKPLSPGVNARYYINFNTPLRKGDFAKKLYTYPQVTVLDSKGANQEIFFEEVPESYTGVDSIEIINPGINYTQTPVVTISGDGSGATASATVVNGRVRTVEVLTPGVNYTRATATISDGIGSECSLSVKLRSAYGTLRTFYYKTNGEKVIINNDAGTVNYLTGKVTLNAFTPLKIATNPFYDKNVLTVNVVPENSVIPPLRNRLLAIDTNNAQAIQLKMVPAT